MRRNKERIEHLHENLRRWYAEHGRHDLPWRRTRDPYRIYLSEIMLQQTQVATVRTRFYGPFLRSFPTLASVAEAKEEEVLKAWEGLGYYSRARNLHRTALLTGGELPSEVEALQALPGIGLSTARAIACFAFGRSEAVLDANVRRILYRFFRRRKATQKQLWHMAERMLDREHAYVYNQAMMDLGATVCLVRDPRCGECPLAPGCRGRGDPQRYPESGKPKVLPVRRGAILLHHDQLRRCWAVERSEERFHGGLWRFPRAEEPRAGRTLGHRTQRYSHFLFEARIVAVEKLESSEKERVVYRSAEEIGELPLGAIDRYVWERFVASAHPDL